MPVESELHVHENDLRLPQHQHKNSTSTTSTASLIDDEVVEIRNLVSGTISTTINLSSHLLDGSPIDFIELNSNGTLLLFRTKSKKLGLHIIKEGSTSTLLSQDCGYAQWAPESNTGGSIIVAQRRKSKSVLVWYDANQPLHVVEYSNDQKSC